MRSLVTKTWCTHTAGSTPKLGVPSLAGTVLESRREILAAPGAGRRGGLQLAMTEIDWTCQRVGVHGKPGSGSKQQWHPQRHFSKRGTEATGQGS